MSMELLQAASPDAAEAAYVGVVLNRPLETMLTYRVPEHLRNQVRVGQRLEVPLGRGNSPTIAYCVAIDPPCDLPESKIKNILAIVDPEPLVDTPMLDLTRWLAHYYVCSWGQTLEAVIPAGVRKQAGTAIRTCVALPDSFKAEGATDHLKLTEKQARVVDVLRHADHAVPIAEVCELAECSPAVVNGMCVKGLLIATKLRIAIDRNAGTARAEKHTEGLPPEALTAEQRGVLERIYAAIETGIETPGQGFAPILLHGVTGSGKTEVYLSAIERVVAHGREAIVLVPEISLTPQTIRRFRTRFDRVAVLHSHLSDAERHRHWASIADGEIQVVVGARSAIFAPCRNLGLIVVDEEHETSFKQDTVPRYNARDVAIKRAQLHGIPAILGSATPSLETWGNARSGRFQLLSLKNRVENRPLPAVHLIDLRNEKPAPVGKGGGDTSPVLSTPLLDGMKRALAAGGQIMLLLNRRGFHTVVMCPKCGQVIKCENCDISLTHHKNQRLLVCHACDYQVRPPDRCPSCRVGLLHYAGIGTERLEREVRAAFPDESIRRMDSDTTRGADSHEQILSSFRKGDVRILLGTQMIAKGLDFPNVTLVGVISADTALHLPDFRAAERTFQLLAQVAGRTGRGERPGRVLVQTYAPDHPAIELAAKHDYLGFTKFELPLREQFALPPYGRMARLIARGENDAAVGKYLVDVAGRIETEARDVAAREASAVGKPAPAPDDPGTVVVLGPSPAPVARIKNLYRHHLQARALTAAALQAVLHAVLPDIQPPSGVELAIDVDPVSML
jgi:primosomal protein N' (replication factor Y)